MANSIIEPPLIDAEAWRKKLRPEQRPVHDIAVMLGQLSLKDEIKGLEADKADKEKWQYLATHDELTDLLNRRGFIWTLEKTINKHPEPQNLAMVIFDLDKLKHFNDTHGHDKGDEYLRFFANFLKNHLRRRGDVMGRNIAGRVGGDEFWALVDLRPTEEQNMHLSHEIRRASFEAWLRDDFEVTTHDKDDFKSVAGFSMGLAFHQEGRSITDWIKAADEDMYYQKKARGNGRD